MRASYVWLLFSIIFSICVETSHAFQNVFENSLLWSKIIVWKLCWQTEAVESWCFGKKKIQTWFGVTLSTHLRVLKCWFFFIKCLCYTGKWFRAFQYEIQLWQLLLLLFYRTANWFTSCFVTAFNISNFKKHMNSDIVFKSYW